MPTFINPIFNALCDIARSDDRDEPLQRKRFHALLRDRIIHQREFTTETPRVSYTPTSLLAFEGNEGGVDFLLRHGGKKSDALEGYAAGGYFAKVSTLLAEGFDSLSAMKGYALGGHHSQVDTLLSEAINNPERFLSLLKEALFSYAQSGREDKVDALCKQFYSQVTPGFRMEINHEVPVAFIRGGHLTLITNRMGIAPDVTATTPSEKNITLALKVMRMPMEVVNRSVLAEFIAHEMAHCGSRWFQERQSEMLPYISSIIFGFAAAGLPPEVIGNFLDLYVPTNENQLKSVRLDSIISAITAYGHKAAVRDIESLLLRYEPEIDTATKERFLRTTVSCLDSHMKTHDQLLQMAAIIHHTPLFNAVIDHGVNQKFAHKAARRNELLKCVSLLREPLELYEPTKGSLLPFIPSASILQTYLQDRELCSWSLAAIGLVNTGRINYEVFFIIARYVSHTSIAIAARPSKHHDDDDAFRLIKQTHSYRMALLASRMREATTQSTTLTPRQKTLQLSWITEDQIRRSTLNCEPMPSKEERDDAIKALSCAL